MFKKLDVVLNADIDLTACNSHRVKVEKVSDTGYRFSSDLRIPRSCQKGFAENIMVRKFGDYKYVRVPCSNPSFYYYHD